MAICEDSSDTRKIYAHVWLSIFVLLFLWAFVLYLQTRRKANPAPKRQKSSSCIDILSSFSTRTISYAMITLHTGVKFIEFVLRELEQGYSFAEGAKETTNDGLLFLKHLLFVLPLAFLFTTFTALLTFWFRIAKNVTDGFYVTGSLRSLFQLFSIANVAVYVISFLFCILIATLDETYEVRAFTNFFIAGFYWLIIVGFVFFAIKLYTIIKTIPNLRTNFHVQLELYRKTLSMFSVMAAVTAALLLVYSVILVYDGVGNYDKESNDSADYPFDPCTLSAFRLGETVPPLMLLYILYSFPMGIQGQSEQRQGANHEYGTLRENPRSNY